jgi:hypothetical protein
MARDDRRLNRVMDALNFEYPDYERLDKGTERAKRKRVVSILSMEATRSVKADEKALKKVKAALEPKAQAPKKWKLDEIPSAEPKVDETPKETLSPSSPTAVEVAEILKVMTESPPFKLISPVRSELTNLLQKMKVPSATEEKVGGQKERQIVNVMQAIEQMLPSASAVKAAIPVDTEDTGGAEAEELAATMSEIDKLISDVVAEKTCVVAEGGMGAVPDKGKKIDDTPSEDKDFDLWHLGGQELSKEDKLELKEFALSCGYHLLGTCSQML